MATTRRDLLKAATALASLPAIGTAAPAGRKPQFCIFSKHLAQFPVNEVGRRAKQLGFDGVDLTVRPKGHILPENVAAQLPVAVESIRAAGVSVGMITTGLTSPGDPALRPTLETASRLKIPYWKPGYFKYDLDNVDRSMDKIRADVKELAEYSRKYSIEAGFHNHSGDYVGSAVWDIRALIHDLDPKWIGYYYDPGHATVEGGLAGWRISQNMAGARIKMVAIKDFYWNKADGKWKPQWCPLGEGMVDWQRVFASLAASGFTGPMSLHVEYHSKDELDAIAKDAAFVKKQIAAAYKS